MLSWLSLASIGCIHTGPKIKVYDKEVCSDLAEDGAHCNHTLQGKPRDIPKAQWDEMRVGWLCSNSTGYNDTESSLDQFCNDYGCDYEMHQAIDALKVRMRGLIARGKKARKKHHLMDEPPLMSYVEF